MNYFSFIKNEQVLEIAIFAVICFSILAFFYGFFTFILFLRNVGFYLRDKNMVEAAKVTKEEKPDPITQFEATNNLLKLINTLIDNQCTVILKTTVALGEKYNYTSIKEDVTSISNTVFNGLDKTMIFNNPDIFLTNEYIMTYITQQTSLTLLNAVITYNTQSGFSAPIVSNE